jgi:hypothetical protein
MRGLAIPALIKRRVATFDGALHQTRLDLADRVDDADVGGDVNHAQLWRHQHHRHFLDVGQVREHFSVPRVFVAPRVQRFLVQWRGADRIDLPRLGQSHRTGDVLISTIAGNRRKLPNGRVGRNQVQVDAVDDSRLVLSF